MDKSILHFIQNQKIVTICCSDGQANPYCFISYFAFNPEDKLLYFKSSASTYHVTLISQKPEISGTILSNKLNILLIKGLQFNGVVLPSDHQLSSNASKEYHKKYPLAFAIQGEVWTIKLSKIKMTDNSLNIGKKFLWERNIISI